MKYLRKFNGYKESKMNEEFIGGLLKNLKDKLSVGFSKMFGSAKKADDLIEKYKKEIYELHSVKIATLKAYSEYIKADQKDKNKENQLLKNISDATKKFDSQIDLLKKKFDIKFNEVIEGEKNKKITNYINLKKIEMQQDLLSEEIKILLGDDLKENEISDPKAKELIKSINKKITESDKLKKDQVSKLESEEKRELGFDIKKATELSKGGETYYWEESPMKKFKFKKNDRIKFFSTSNRSETRALVLEDLDDKVKIKTENDNVVEIDKRSIISSEAYDKSKLEKDKTKKEDQV